MLHLDSARFPIHLEGYTSLVRKVKDKLLLNFVSFIMGWEARHNRRQEYRNAKGAVETHIKGAYYG